jgi:hypothetical protein
MSNLIEAPNEDTYDLELASFEAFCKRVDFTDFFSYFSRNWDSCREMWVIYKRFVISTFPRKRYVNAMGGLCINHVLAFVTGNTSRTLGSTRTTILRAISAS